MKEEIQQILIDYDFDKSTPGTFDFVKATEKLWQLIEQYAIEQRKEEVKRLASAFDKARIDELELRHNKIASIPISSLCKEIVSIIMQDIEKRIKQLNKSLNDKIKP